jgi:hypothetical protein
MGFQHLLLLKVFYYDILKKENNEPKASTFETFQSDFNTKEIGFGTGVENLELAMKTNGSRISLKAN